MNQDAPSESIPLPKRPAARSRRRSPIFGVLFLLFACSVFSYEDREHVSPQNWAKGRGPVVPHDSFPTDCTLCHVSGNWHEIRADFEFDHEAKTGIALQGAHAAAECLRCHNDRGPVARFAARGCAGCHEDWHRRQLGTACEDCHTETDWRPKEVIASHNRTRFPLIGAHAGIACFRCHEGAQVGNFKRADTRCESCHQADLARTQNPNHVTAGWTTNCEQCHVPMAWKGQSFVHRSFPLTGAHTQTDCTKCHAGGVYQGTPRNCEACHLQDSQRVTSPNHVTAGWTNCQQCHSTTSFSGAHFVHNFWPLTGSHTATECAKCHGNGVYKGTPTNCVGCHQGDYNATTNPNHQASKFPNTCESCHTTTTWKGATFNHRFPLTKDHNVTCSTCHTNPANYQTFSCLVCHDHNKTKMDDKHKGRSGYSYTSAACYGCHPNGR